VSGEGGQICPPNLEKEKIYRNLTRARAPRRASRRGAPSRSFSSRRPRLSRSNSGALGSVVMAFPRLKLCAFRSGKPTSRVMACLATGHQARPARGRRNGSPSSATAVTTLPQEPTFGGHHDG
jgi:hypothetical protein